MPAQSPTLSPTLSAMTAGLRDRLQECRLHFADQVGTDVGTLGEDTAAETGKDGDEGAAEAETNELADHILDWSLRA